MYTHSQISELITAIKGRGEVPFKFVYIGEEGAKRWDKIARNRSVESSRGINSVEGKLLNAKVRDFLNSFQSLDKLNIIDIGPGNGTPILPLLRPLKDLGVEFRYVPVDISKEMLALAADTVKKEFPEVTVKPLQLDFEQGNFAEATYSLREDGFQNLMLLLGTTLGNQSDRSRVLTNFRDSMTSSDFLIIGVELVNLHKIDKLLKHYRGEDAEHFVFTAAESIGLQPDQGTFEAVFNKELHQIENYFIFNCEVALDFAGEQINFEEGDRLLLARSHKFTEWVFAKDLADCGFRLELLTTSSERGYSLVMCQPQRFNY